MVASPLRLPATVRFRVTALATLLTLVTLAVTAAVLLTVQQRLLTQSLDRVLDQRIESLARAVVDGTVPPTLPSSEDDDVSQVVSAGRVVAASPNIAAGPAIAGRIGPARTVYLSVDDAPFRLLSRAVAGTGGSSTVHVAASLDAVDDSVTVLRHSLSIAVPAVAAVLAALVWALVGRTLRPVEAIRAQVAGLSGADLARRVPEPGSRDEIDRLARTMNSMLERVEDASLRQQRFTADASHELRSPLTRIRAEVEVDLLQPDGADLRATHHSVLEEVIGLQRLVGDLLYLARYDAATPSSPYALVDLDDLVFAAAAGCRLLGGCVVDTAGVQAAQVLGDPAQLLRAITNLTDNAVRHAHHRVRLTLVEDRGCVVLTVQDDGPGIPAADRERVFDRFVRLSDARDAATGGTGLGLAITRGIVERHGGTVHVDAAVPADSAAPADSAVPVNRVAPADSGEPVGARFVLSLPTPTPR